MIVPIHVYYIRNSDYTYVGIRIIYTVSKSFYFYTTLAPIIKLYVYLAEIKHFPTWLFFFFLIIVFILFKDSE